MRLASSAWPMPGSPRTITCEISPGDRSRSCAAAKVNAVNVEPPASSADPKVAMPTTFTSCCSGVWMRTVSPTAKSPSFATPRSITTSSAAFGSRPSARS